VAGTLSADGVNDYLGVAVAVTGLTVGAIRYWTVLRGASKRQVEYATAIGFFAGLVLSAPPIAYLLVT